MQLFRMFCPFSGALKGRVFKYYHFFSSWIQKALHSEILQTNLSRSLCLSLSLYLPLFCVSNVCVITCIINKNYSLQIHCYYHLFITFYLIQLITLSLLHRISLFIIFERASWKPRLNQLFTAFFELRVFNIFFIMNSAPREINIFWLIFYLKFQMISHFNIYLPDI